MLQAVDCLAGKRLPVACKWDVVTSVLRGADLHLVSDGGLAPQGRLVMSARETVAAPTVAGGLCHCTLLFAGVLRQREQLLPSKAHHHLER